MTQARVKPNAQKTGAKKDQYNKFETFFFSCVLCSQNRYFLWK